MTSDGNNFNDFPNSQLTKFQTFMLTFAKFKGGGSAPFKYAPERSLKVTEVENGTA